MKRRALPTRVRLTLVNVIVFGVAAAVAAVALWLVFAYLQYSAIDASLSSEAQAVLSSIEAGNGTISVDSAAQLPGETDSGIAVAVALVGSDGRVIQTNGQLSAADLATIRPGRRGPQFRSITLHGQPYEVLVRPVRFDAASTGTLVMARPLAETRDTLLWVAVLLAVGVTGLVSVAAALVYWMTGRVLHPVRVMSQTAHEISERDLHQRIELDLPADELGQLATTLNQMLARLDTAFQAMGRFTADAAHELRTPVAFIRNEAEVTLRRKRSPAEYEASIRAILVEAEALSRTADRLLLLARADAGALSAGFERIDLTRLVEETVERWLVPAQAQNVHLGLRLPEEATVQGDRDLLRRLIGNLLENAVRYTPAGGTISVDLTSAPPWLALRVTDTGPGVQPEIAATIFQRFSRGDRARGRAEGGTGLGLALAAAIAAAHGGSITLDSAGPGASFRVRLPVPAPVTGKRGAQRLTGSRTKPQVGPPDSQPSASGNAPAAMIRL
jgi:heavy metal sensor kinase